MPGGVEDGVVDAVAAAVVGPVLRRVLVGGEAELDRVGLAAVAAERAAFLEGPVAGLPADGLHEGGVGSEDVADPGRGEVVGRGRVGAGHRRGHGGMQAAPARGVQVFLPNGCCFSPSWAMDAPAAAP